MKKYTYMTLLILLVLSLTGCGSKVDSSAPIEGAAAYAEAEEPVVSMVPEESAVSEDSAADDIGVDLDSGPALILPQLESAFNEQDAKGILECFTPDSIQAVSGVVQLLGPESKMFGHILGAVLADSDYYDNIYWGASVILKPLDYTSSGAAGELSYYAEWEDGSYFEKTIPVTLIDDNWYISLEQMDFTTSKYGPIPVSAGITEDDVAEGLYPYSEYIDGKKSYGFMNISGKIIIEPFFSEVGAFSEDGRCPVCMDRKWGIIDKFGNLVVDFEFDEINSNPSEGFWVCYLRDRGYGFLNLDTGNVISCQYNSCGIFSDGVVPVQQDGYWGAVDTEGNIVIEFLYDEMRSWEIPFSNERYELSFINGLIPVKVNGATGVIDSTGNYRLPLDRENLALCRIGGSFFAGNGGQYHPSTTICTLDGTEILDTGIGNCVGYINDTILIDGWGNVYGVDLHGNIIFNVNEDIFPLLNVVSSTVYSAPKPKSQMKIDNYIADIKATVTGFGFDGWQLLEMYTSENMKSYVYNLINDLGETFFDEWYEWIMHSYQYIAGYDEDSGITYLYNYDGELLYQHEGEFCNFVGDYFLVDSKKKKMIILSSGAVEEYCGIDFLKSNDSAVIVFDGVFYGLYAKDGLVGDGITYNKIFYDEGSRICTMELGATTEKYRLGPDGTANIID